MNKKYGFSPKGKGYTIYTTENGPRKRSGNGKSLSSCVFPLLAVFLVMMILFKAVLVIGVIAIVCFIIYTVYLYLRDKEVEKLKIEDEKQYKEAREEIESSQLYHYINKRREKSRNDKAEWGYQLDKNTYKLIESKMNHILMTNDELTSEVKEKLCKVVPQKTAKSEECLERIKGLLPKGFSDYKDSKMLFSMLTGSEELDVALMIYAIELFESRYLAAFYTFINDFNLVEIKKCLYEISKENVFKSPIEALCLIAKINQFLPAKKLTFLINKRLEAQSVLAATNDTSYYIDKNGILKSFGEKRADSAEFDIFSITLSNMGFIFQKNNGELVLPNRVKMKDVFAIRAAIRADRLFVWKLNSLDILDISECKIQRSFRDAIDAVEYRGVIAVLYSNGEVTIEGDSDETIRKPEWSRIRQIVTRRNILFGLDENGNVNILDTESMDKSQKEMINSMSNIERIIEIMDGMIFINNDESYKKLGYIPEDPRIPISKLLDSVGSRAILRSRSGTIYEIGNDKESVFTGLKKDGGIFENVFALDNLDNWHHIVEAKISESHSIGVGIDGELYTSGSSWHIEKTGCRANKGYELIIDGKTTLPKKAECLVPIRAMLEYNLFPI